MFFKTLLFRFCMVFSPMIVSLALGGLLIDEAQGKSNQGKENLNTCLHCHVPFRGALATIFDSKRDFQGQDIERGDCVRCHVGMQTLPEKELGKYHHPYPLDEVNRLRWSGSLGMVPALDLPLAPPKHQAKTEGKVKGKAEAIVEGKPALTKYDPCGLIQYLKSPVPRLFLSKESMFPMVASELQRLGLSQRCETPLAFSAELISKGEALFTQHGCATCHSAEASPETRGPRIRLGIPLLSLSFFQQRLKGTVASHMVFQWDKKGGEFRRKFPVTATMPSYSKLSGDEISNLYAYVSSARTDLPEESLTSEDLVIVENPELLFNEVRSRVFDKSCKHCHKASTELSKSSYEIFGAEGVRNAVVPLPSSKLGLQKSGLQSSVLSPGPQCQEAEIVKRLKIRHLEWSGKVLPTQLEAAKPSRLRGMPLLNAPIPYRDIQILQRWTELGCPTGKENLCSRCTKAK